MEILLIKTPHRGFLHEIGRFYPVGLFSLASALQGASHRVSVFDSLAFPEDNHVIDPYDLSDTERSKLEMHPRWGYLVHWGACWSRIHTALSEKQFDIIGISDMFTPFAESALRCAELAKSVLPQCFIIFGGCDATVRWRDLVKFKFIDAVVLGEGERAIVEICERISAGRDLSGMLNVVSRSRNNLQHPQVRHHHHH